MSVVICHFTVPTLAELGVYWFAQVGKYVCSFCSSVCCKACRISNWRTIWVHCHENVLLSLVRCREKMQSLICYHLFWVSFITII